MTKEDIKKAATEYANEACRPLWRTGNEQVCMVDFMEGAKWRINSVWHDASKAPKQSKMLIAICKDGREVLCGPNNSDWKTTVKIFFIVKWAYIEDLIPNTEE